ncbi:UDP-N-acetylglucosamine--peptide N-acetylglucosaminyltransferase 110 kDa subunit [Hondaea fermentalgiana]|uniref:UDP-N-acetylglucosamine--peptide N-acetylglucosaminyltransferase 110 kDa subunit n=1 Tax=Hondaea fermentalgiana TaxID=2315210 RepID=A0A2R5GV64_9STRA|nr:UDP-N-acetylglucosamine--peptide N-acetylglucosaminyltransferase 110 kDa subunit [Hondaea fermentalgiana]|eukprot:GBG34740.1 UDP-N-acetylglucosamine--peptide N-acetylglucosaminyltransferase 110 kDa subunit [Hondaea fermentalgiana]
MAGSIENAKQAFISRDFKGAIAYYERAIKELPEDQLHVALSNKGAALMNTGHTKEAIKCFRLALENKADHYESLHNMGVAFTADKKYKKALDCFEKTIEDAPFFYAAHCGKSEVLASLGRFEEAAAAAKAGIQEDNEQPIAYADLAYAYLKLRRFEAAVENYERAIALKDRSPETARLYALALSELALSHQKKNDVKRALDLYERSVEKHETPLSLHNLGVLHLRLRQPSKAKTCFSRALKRDPDFFESNAALGVLHAREARYDHALPYLRRAYDADPQNTENLYNLGIVYMKEGKRSDAQRAFKVLIKLDPSNQDASTALKLLKKSQSSSPSSAVSSPSAYGTTGSTHSRTRSQRSSSVKPRRSKRKTYTAEELLANPPPPGVDPKFRECYLSEEDFMNIFGISFEEYNNLKDWERERRKKENNFF